MLQGLCPEDGWKEGHFLSAPQIDLFSPTPRVVFAGFIEKYVVCTIVRLGRSSLY